MMTTTYFRDLLAREAFNLSFPAPTDHQVKAMSRYALDLALGYPTAPAEALAIKLLTVFDGVSREMRLLVALAAIEAAGDDHQLAA